MFTRNELDKLLNSRKEVNVSIFLTTAAEERNLEKGRIKLKNLIKQCENKLLELVEKDKVKKITYPFERLLEDTKYWNSLDKGLAMFATEEDFYHYTVPFEFQEFATVKDDFYIKPLFPVFQQNGQFYVLTISQNDMRLLHCTRDDVKEIDLEEVPTSLQEALKYDDPEDQLQFNTRTPNSGSSKRNAVFHGHGYGMEDKKTDILRYFQEVNTELINYIQDTTTPIVLAGVDYLFPIFKEANKELNIINEGIEGNVEEEVNKDLQQEAWKIIKPYFEQEEQKAIEDYNNLIGTGKASNDLNDIVSSAYNQRVESLFIAKDEQVWGNFDEKQNQVDISSEDDYCNQELLNFAAIHTFINQGKVYVMDKDKMPGNSERLVAAVYRY
ncbi:hypothetical protein RH915_06180 [Serpentinicella sp. ANB-PHB4]|uniref:baeRF7 domain-containing protein n=1 Tax=Serpentinicella sp. ANB-PHB4 TaxID=3074076 RepID=UPI00285FAA43|nr:hypothetical protein [Serpentinicella sp. ANB-PHB4]MDR5659072.1 hypothetical protein [Serpentinicella sp. ANB-PHB4]